jgi:hypothetical protein
MVITVGWPGSRLGAEEVGSRWGTADQEREYYPITELPIPAGEILEAGAFESLPDGRIAVGTRHGDIFMISGVDEAKPQPEYHRFASGLDEIFGLAWRDDALYVTQSCELTQVWDSNGDGCADRFEVVSDAWGYGNYHEYAFGSKFDAEGNLYVALGLSYSYYSRELFRGWAIKITPQGESVPFASGMRSPGGIGINEHGSLFYIESQGPWNSSCSLKAVTEGGFVGHPASYNWYPYAPNIGKVPLEPVSGSRALIEKARIPELQPPAVIFPYIRMGRSISGFVVNRTQGKFGPFEDQLFLGDYTLSVIMRATTEKINGIWQGACYPFREGLSTGVLNIHFTPGGSLISGGTNRGWPVRGLKPYSLQRLDWSGVMPFEIQRITITSNGFRVEFTKPVAVEQGADPKSYKLTTFTHVYHEGYGGPEVEKATPKVISAMLAPDGLSATLVLDTLAKGHVHEFDLKSLRSKDGGSLLHHNAYYTVNEVPAEGGSRSGGEK